VNTGTIIFARSDKVVFTRSVSGEAILQSGHPQQAAAGFFISKKNKQPSQRENCL
jgi:hypothetical protein